MLLDLNVISYRLEMYRSKSRVLFPICKSNGAFYHAVSDKIHYSN